MVNEMIKKTRFDLEEAIMVSWATCDDLRLVLELTDKIKVDKAEDLDKLQNLLIGVEALHHERMEKVFSLFEKMVRDGEIT